MGSFYGSWSGGNGTSAGTFNYNELENIPIKNLVGTSTSPINLSELVAGEYLLKGNFEYNINQEVQKFDYPLQLSVTFDEETGEKHIYYIQVIDNGYYLIDVYYSSDNEIATDKILLSGSSENIILAAKEEAIQESANYTDIMLTLEEF